MRRILIGVLTGLLAIAVTVPAVAAVTAADLRDVDVVFDGAVPYTEADRERLADAAADLADKNFPVKFVVVEQALANPDTTALDLRAGLIAAAGRDAIDGVFVLGPRQFGSAADAFDRERVKAFEDERATFTTDPIQGSINVAKRLQDCDARNSVNEPCGFLDRPVDNGFSRTLLALLIAVAAIGVVVFTFARRAAKRAEARQDQNDERAAFEPMLDVLSAQITDLGDEVSTGPNAERAKARYDEAVTAYGEIQDALVQGDEWDGQAMRDRMRSAIQSALAARALIDGKPEPVDVKPNLTGLCAFDPKHGRAVTERRITTPSGDAADAPVCATCAAGLDGGHAPSPRMVVLRGRQVPYWRIEGMGGMFDPQSAGILGNLLEEALNLTAALSGRRR